MKRKATNNESQKQLLSMLQVDHDERLFARQHGCSSTRTSSNCFAMMLVTNEEEP
jgi:hypothetical protein